MIKLQIKPIRLIKTLNIILENQASKNKLKKEKKKTTTTKGTQKSNCNNINH